MSSQRSMFDTAVEAFESSLTTGRAEAFVARDVIGMGRQEAARHLGRDPSTVDTQLQEARERVRLPEISKIEYPTRAGEDQQPAVVIWFENDAAVQYVWNGEQIEEQTYRNGTVHQAFEVGGDRDELAEFALTSVSEYIGYRDDPESLRKDWSPVWEIITGVGA